MIGRGVLTVFLSGNEVYQRFQILVVVLSIDK
jgi:hypothetical protein